MFLPLLWNGIDDANENKGVSYDERSCAEIVGSVGNGHHEFSHFDQFYLKATFISHPQNKRQTLVQMDPNVNFDRSKSIPLQVTFYQVHQQM